MRMIMYSNQRRNVILTGMDYCECTHLESEALRVYADEGMYEEGLEELG